MNKTNNMRRKDIRWQLLATVSAAALLGSAYAADAADSDRPLIWIEAGGQLERLSGDPAPFSPAFFSLVPAANLAPMVNTQRPSPYSIGEEGKISFSPENSDWVFSAAIRYGRSHAARHLHHQTPIPGGLGPVYAYYGAFVLATNFPQNNLSYGDGQTSLSESHLILDFQAGKDVGLGMFGAHGSSVVSAGVRLAQFTSGSGVTLHARNYTFNFATATTGKYRLPLAFHQTYAAVLHANRNTHAVGPSISWDASLPIAGNASDSTINFDWGVNAAALFGRQRAQVHHQTTGYYFKVHPNFAKYTHNYANHPADQNRSRSVMIPNLGGFAGLSFHYGDAKISFGYRGDFFFGALDGGIDQRKSTTIGFCGPFASLSVGLGD
jgi:hypothetical protein